MTFIRIIDIFRVIYFSPLFLWLLFSTSISSITAQQIAHFTQYIDNGLFYNPAYAGSKRTLNFTATHREQWAGIEGHPRTTTLQIHAPTKYSSVGIGAVISDESEGLIHHAMFNADISYSLLFKNNARLSFGTKIGAHGLHFDRNGLFPFNTVNADIPEYKNNYHLNIGFGFLYQSEVFFMGISSPKILVNQYDTIGNNASTPHYFLTMGHIGSVSTKWKIRNSLQVKIASPNHLGLDLALTLIYNQAMWIGWIYRYNNGGGMFVQFQISKNLKVGVATEINFNKARNYGMETLELLLSYDLNFTKKGIYSPRYF